MGRSSRVSLFLLICFVLFASAGRAEVITFDHSGKQAGFELVQQSAQGVELIYRLERVRLEDVLVGSTVYRQVSTPGVFLPSQAGTPNLPSLGRMVALPHGAAARLEVIGTRRETLRGIDVVPAAPIPLDTDDSPPVYVPDPAIYGRDAYWPERIAQVSERKKMRGVENVMLGISPFQYNPARKELVVYSEIHLRVVFEGGNGSFGEDRLRSKNWDSILRQHVINFDSLPALESLPTDGMTPEGEYAYVILVPDDPVYIAQAERLKQFRIQQGISTGIVTLTETGSTAARIEEWVNLAYDVWVRPPEAVLLLADWVPDGDTDGITCAKYNNYCASDNLYADVDGDHLPDIVFARMTATPENVERMVDKVIDYETNPPVNPVMYDHPLFACGWQTDRWFCLCSEITYGFMDKILLKDPVREYVDGETATYWSSNLNTWMLIDYFGPEGLGYIPATPEYLTDWTGDADGISASINNGAFVVQHRDHGGLTGWGHPSYTIDDLQDLHNPDLPYVFSMNCLTGTFDSVGEVFAEAFHRMENGALGITAATQVSYSFVNDVLDFGIFDYMWKEFDPGYGLPGPSDPRPAFALASGKYYLRDSQWPSLDVSYKDLTNHLFHAHGDAYTTLYTEMPQTLAVDSWGFLPVGSHTFGVVADEGSTIALTVGDQILGVAEATGGWQEMEVEPYLEEGEATLTVTQVNHFRHSETLPIGFPCTYTVQPADVPIGQISQVRVTMWGQEGQPAANATVTIDGWGIAPVSGLTNSSGEISLTVNPPYGENLIIRGQEDGAPYYCLEGQLPVTGGADLSNEAISAATPIVDLPGMLTPSFEGLVTGSCAVSGFTLYAAGCGVDANVASGGSNSAQLAVVPMQVGTLKAAIGKPGYRVYEQAVAVAWVEGTVSGRVTDSQGNPVEGALVQFYPPGSDPAVDRAWAYDETDENGAYSFSSPLRTAYWDAYVKKFGYLPLKQTVLVKYGPTTIDFNLVSAPHGLLSGRVTDANTGEPLKAWITAYRIDRDEVYASTLAEAGTGAYEISLPYYDYRIVAEAVPHFPREALVTIDQPSAVQNFSLTPSLASVLVIDSADTSVLTSPGAEFERDLIDLGCKAERQSRYDPLDPDEWWDYSMMIWAVSQLPDAGQRVALRNYIAAGGRVLVTGANLATQAYLFFEDWFKTDVLHGERITSPSGYLDLIDAGHALASLPNHLSDMTVVSFFGDEAIDPYPDAEVVFGWSDYPGSSAVLTWDDDADPDHGNLIYMSLNYTQFGDSDQLALLENMVHYLNNRDWQADVGRVTGKATLEGEVDHSGIQITTNPATYSALTRSDGGYTLYNLPPGTYTVIASKDGFVSDQVSGVVVVTDGTASGIDLVLSAGGGLEYGAIAGTALLNGETDHSGILISTIPASSTTTTSTTGSYTLSNVPVGTYSVLATKDGWTDDQVDNVEVVAGQTTSGIQFVLYEEVVNLPPVAENLQISTKANQSVTITLKASDPNGDPLTYFCVDLPDNGTLTGCDDGDDRVTYTPDKQFTGNDTFTFRAYDGKLYSNVATVTVKVLKTGGGKTTDRLEVVQPTTKAVRLQ